MDYATIADRLDATWSLTLGTPRSDYPASALDTAGNPSAPVWIEEDEIELAGDLGTASELVAVFLFNHTFSEGLDVRFQAASAPLGASPAPSLSINDAIPILAPYRNGFGCNAWIDLRLAHVSALSRTFRYVSITNVGEPNDRSIGIGEIWIVSAWRALTPNDLQHNYRLPQEQLVSKQSSKKGVQMRYDTGSRTRRLGASCRISDLEQYDAVLDWIDGQYGIAQPMITILDPTSASRRIAEPRLVYFQDAVVTPQSLLHNVAYDIDVNFEELGFGSPILA